jgi:hypothetical protein
MVFLEINEKNIRARGYVGGIFRASNVRSG